MYAVLFTAWLAPFVFTLAQEFTRAAIAAAIAVALTALAVLTERRLRAVAESAPR